MAGCFGPSGRAMWSGLDVASLNARWSVPVARVVESDERDRHGNEGPPRRHGWCSNRF